mgnify:CR=1 FL=1
MSEEITITAGSGNVFADLGLQPIAREHPFLRGWRAGPRWVARAEVGAPPPGLGSNEPSLPAAAIWSRTARPASSTVPTTV